MIFQPHVLKEQFPVIIKALNFTYLDSTSGNVTIVRKTSCEGRSIVECVEGLTFCELELLLESIDVLPVLKYLFFLFREVGSLGDYRLRVRIS